MSSKAVKKFFDAIKTQKTNNSKSSQELMPLLLGAIGAVTGALNTTQLQELGEQVKKLSQIMLLQKISDIKPFAGSDEAPVRHGDDGQPDITRSAMLDALEKLVTVKPDVGSDRIFLLHRATTDFEYDTCAKPFGKDDKNVDAELRPVEYQTLKETEWLTTFFNAETNRHGVNPLVSAWVPESSVATVNGSQANKGTWGENGANPQADLVKVIVKAGTYQIYAELKS